MEWRVGNIYINYPLSITVFILNGRFMNAYYFLRNTQMDKI